MEKEVLLSRLKQLKENVDNAKGSIDEPVVTLANKLINDTKELYKEDLSDLEEIKTAKYDFGEKGSQQEVSAKLGQAIAVLESDIGGPAIA
jgi:hypothetical protein